MLNWNKWKDTLECLESLASARISDYHLLVVDNNSENDSVTRIIQWVKEKYGLEPKLLFYSSRLPGNFAPDRHTFSGGENSPYFEHLTIIRNECNYGFAEGNNIAIRYASHVFNPNYFLLLNNDVVVDANFAKQLTKTIESDLKNGVVGAVNYYYGDPKRICASGGIINWFTGKKIDATENKIDNGQFTGQREVDYVPGSCFLVRKAVLDTIGLFDKVFFFYYEETDFCVRAKKKGFHIIADFDAKIWHKVSASAGRTSDFTIFYLARNWFFFMKKNATRKQYSIFIASFFAYDFIKITSAIMLRRRNPKRYIIFLRAILSGLKFRLDITGDERCDVPYSTS